eukprot:4998765-Pleurochrysis_carterae.AAC.1
MGAAGPMPAPSDATAWKDASCCSESVSARSSVCWPRAASLSSAPPSAAASATLCLALSAATCRSSPNSLFGWANTSSASTTGTLVPECVAENVIVNWRRP